MSASAIRVMKFGGTSLADADRFRTVADLVALAKATPGQLSYSSAGIGSSSHLSMELLKAQLGLFITHIPYRGAVPALSVDGEDTVLVFTSLVDQKGQFSGPGYWVMTPLVLATGGTVFINRGFVPEASGPAFAGGGPVDTGLISIAGVARSAEATGSFTPSPDLTRRVEWVRNPARLAATIPTPRLPPKPARRRVSVSSSMRSDSRPKSGARFIEMSTKPPQANSTSVVASCGNVDAIRRCMLDLRSRGVAVL